MRKNASKSNYEFIMNYLFNKKKKEGISKEIGNKKIAKCKF